MSEEVRRKIPVFQEPTEEMRSAWRRQGREDPTNLRNWFPLVEQSGVLVPRTKILETELDLTYLCEGEIPESGRDWSLEGYAAFVEEVQAAAMGIGMPCFLRTGMGSGKHEWKDTCHVTELATMADHIRAITYWSNLVDFVGLDTHTWVVREFLPLRIATTLLWYNGMPLAREFRLFVGGGGVTCIHPYWPAGAVERGGPGVENWRELLEQHHVLNEVELAELTTLGEKVSAAVPGSWSVDFAQHKDGRWFCIDMAVAAKSFHWAGCETGLATG